MTKHNASPKRLQRLRASIADITNPPTENPYKAMIRKQRLVAHIRALAKVAATISLGGKP